MKRIMVAFDMVKGETVTPGSVELSVDSDRLDAMKNPLSQHDIEIEEKSESLWNEIYSICCEAARSNGCEMDWINTIEEVA